MSVLQNPVIPIVVRFSMRQASLDVVNMRTVDSVRPDRLAHAERACAMLGERLQPILQRQLNEAMHDERARRLTAEIQHAANLVTEETNVIFVVNLETDADRDRDAVPGPAVRRR